MKRWIGTSLLVVGVLSSPFAHAEDWPSFRGPGEQGHAKAKDLPVSWDGEKGVKWKAELAGEGWSSPALAKGKIYLTAAVAKSDAEKPDRSLRALRIDAATGKIDWDVEVFVQEGASAPNIHGKNSHASPTPVVESDRVFVHFGHQGTACLDLNGKILWSTREIKYPPVHGAGCSPVRVDDLLVFSCDGGEKPFVVALDVKTGKERWRFERGPVERQTFAFCTPLVIEVDGKKQIFTPGAQQASALDPKDGREIWKVRYTGYSLVCRPIYSHGMVLFSTCYDSPVVFAVKVDGQGDVTDTHVAWTLSKGAPHNPSMLAIGDELYMVADDGVASCVDIASGKAHWTQRVGGAYTSSLLYADGKIYMQNEEGKGVVVAPGKKFQKLGENNIGQRTLSSYAATDGAIFLRTDKALYRIGK